MERLGCRVTVWNLDDQLGSRLLTELDFPQGALTILMKRANYPDYIELMSSHRLVFQLDQSRVPGQVAGDTLLCRTLCVGGNGAIEQIAYPNLCSTEKASEALLPILESLMQDDRLYEKEVRTAQRIALEKLSFGAIAKRLEDFFQRI